MYQMYINDRRVMQDHLFTSWTGMEEYHGHQHVRNVKPPLFGYWCGIWDDPTKMGPRGGPLMKAMHGDPKARYSIGYKYTIRSPLVMGKRGYHYSSLPFAYSQVSCPCSLIHLAVVMPSGDTFTNAPLHQEDDDYAFGDIYVSRSRIMVAALSISCLAQPFPSGHMSHAEYINRRITQLTEIERTLAVTDAAWTVYTAPLRERYKQWLDAQFKSFRELGHDVPPIGAGVKWQSN